MRNYNTSRLGGVMDDPLEPRTQIEERQSPVQIGSDHPIFTDISITGKPSLLHMWVGCPRLAPYKDLRWKDFQGHKGPRSPHKMSSGLRRQPQGIPPVKLPLYEATAQDAAFLRLYFNPGALQYRAGWL
ncbi:uncharacterized protein N7500_007580 [Penicillium coprophilum]|uniref:uncharacterized protein n=1 Tax=Penicillium coprophilum TaxID=36646 RepID=UPI0023A1CCC9|nr:uncharacterized protein N7500_007580 [Penicillium coprophilum]KAJ5165750.1 hypothetical protein N7500_007580 [Penicillium coprophilum]